MAPNAHHAGAESATSAMTTNAWNAILSIFGDTDATKRAHLSSRLASIHSAVDQELQPDYHVEWEKLYVASNSHRSATEMLNTSMYSALPASGTPVDVAVEVAVQPVSQQQQNGATSRKTTAPTWQWPEWDMGMKHRTVVSMPLSPRRTAL